MATSPNPAVRVALEDARFREALVRLVRKRVPAGEVDDIVQNAMAEAVLSKSAPCSDADTLRRWIWGVARHKVADFHRRPRPELVLPRDGAYEELCDASSGSDDAGCGARDWLRWAPRVRQRVNRMRKHLKSRWAREVAALAALGVALACLWLAWNRWHTTTEAPVAVPERIASPREIAEGLRHDAEEALRRGAYDEALERLDRAQGLDPAGDDTETMRALRERIAVAKQPPPPPVAPAPPPQTKLAPRDSKDRSEHSGKAGPVMKPRGNDPSMWGSK